MTEAFAERCPSCASHPDVTLLFEPLTPEVRVRLREQAQRRVIQASSVRPSGAPVTALAPIVAHLSPDRPIKLADLAVAVGRNPDAVWATLARAIKRGEPIAHVPRRGYVLLELKP